MLDGRAATKSVEVELAPGRVDGADRPAVVVHDDREEWKKSTSGRPRISRVEHLDRLRRPQVVAQQDRDELGVGAAHAGVERPGELAAVVGDQLDPGVGDALPSTSSISTSRAGSATTTARQPGAVCSSRDRTASRRNSAR